MTRYGIATAIGMALLTGAALAGEAPPAFTRKPTAMRDGDTVKIAFAVSRETDVAVSIEDNQGKVVRRLAAGVLGRNPPAPLKPGLAQAIEWDGKADWGKPAGAGPFRVRVALGLGAAYDRVLLSEPQNIGAPMALAASRDGTLYVLAESGATYAWGGQSILALDRDGNYQRTVIPPPASTTREQWAAMGTPIEVGGRTVPLVQNMPNHQLTALSVSSGVDMTVTPQGQILVLARDARMGLVDISGAPAPPALLGPSLRPDVPAASFETYERSYVAASADGTYAYFSGLAPRRSYSSQKTLPWSAVFRVRLPERAPAEPFFGDPEKTGSDETHLGSHAHGMAPDGKGHLLVCDPKNNRVVAVSEAEGAFAGALAVESPEMVAVDRRAGAVYFLSILPKGEAEVVKFSNWKDAKPIARFRQRASRGEPKWCLALDAGAGPPVVWLTDKSRLLRVDDLGDRFGEPHQVNTGDLGNLGFVNLTVDHWRDDPEVYVRSGRGGYWWSRCNEKTGEVDHLKNMAFYSDAAGPCLEVGPDGNLYTQAWPQFLHKWDRNGKPLKWDAPYILPEGVAPYSGITEPPNAIFMPVCMVFMTHTLGFRSDGHFFAFERKPTAPARSRKALFEYAPSGKRVGGPIIWEASDAVIGPRFDQEGNIYLADGVRPLDQMVPDEFAGVTGPVTPKSGWEQGEPKAIAAYYGSILKFSPKGGMIAYQKGHYALDRHTPPYDGDPKLDPSLKTVDAGCFAAGSGPFRYVGVKVTGAEWMHLGISHFFIGGCNCENTRFDVDPFGRVWYPDLGRYRVGVLDTNGNLITTFGSYGNAESRGPDSPVVDPKTGKIRPRRPDDPKDLKSPFAEPEIAFAWLIGVGATDKYAYMGDSLNRRLLRARLTYATEETCEVK